MAGRQGFEPRSDGPEPPVLPLDDLPVQLVIVEKRIASFKTKHNRIGWNNRFRIPISKSLNKSSFRFGLPAFACGYPRSRSFRNLESRIRNRLYLVRTGSRAKKCIRLYDFFDAFM
jgi:hypothetical protein